MIIRILQANQWTKPVYFAVTVSYENQLGLQPYFRMDGLAYQVMPFPVRTIKPGILRTNLMEKFLYRGLNDPKVYLNIDTIKLLGNVRQAFLQLAQSYLREGRKSEALAVLDTMSRRLPVEHVPFSNERSALLVADYFKRAGRPDEYKNLLRYLIPNRLVTREDRLGLASYYAHGLNDWEQSEILFRELINQDPNDVQAVSSLYQVLRESRQYDKAVRLLEDWLLRHPKDPVAEKELESMKTLAAQDSSRGSAASRP
jgi:tetratricopeptide (TPR) repeat protein